MTVMLVGGGSGGHLTPLIAVGDALKAIDSSTHVIQVGQRGESLQEVVDHNGIDETLAIAAGKFRRYHGESFVSHLFDFKTLTLNIRDFFRFLRGTVQAWRMLGRHKPDVIFLKGGFVCVPVGLAARLRKIPYVTHDSDAIPGLANKITAKNAVFNLVAMDPENYPYSREKTKQVGIPIQPEFQHVSAKEMKVAKKALKVPDNSEVIVSVGGGLGAQNLNHALTAASSSLLAPAHRYIIHLSGKALYEETNQLYEKYLSNDTEKLERVLVIDFSTDLYMLTAAADIVIARAGATNIAELAQQGKATLLVPNPVLTGGQQLHNAEALKKLDAAEIIHEEDIDQLGKTVEGLLGDKKRLAVLAKNMHELAQSDSARIIAQTLMEIAG